MQNPCIRGSNHRIHVRVILELDCKQRSLDTILEQRPQPGGAITTLGLGFHHLHFRHVSVAGKYMGIVPTQQNGKTMLPKIGAKAANQVIVGLNIGAVAEALTLARNAGVDPGKVREALKGGFADSRILEVHGQRMVDDDFRPGGKCVTQRKDLFQALELAGEFGSELPATRLCMGLYDKLISEGHGELDHSALIKVLEK